MENDIFTQNGITASPDKIVEFIRQNKDRFDDFLNTPSQEALPDCSDEREASAEQVCELKKDPEKQEATLLNTGNEGVDTTLSLHKGNATDTELRPVTEILSERKAADSAKIALSKEEKEEKEKNEALAFQIKNKQITFQNGKVKQAYCIDFDFEKLGMPEIAEVSFTGLEKIGLQYDLGEKKIKGIPTLSGDHKIEMKFKRKDWTENKPLLSRDVLFIINPDPRELWSKNLPTPGDIEYYKPDSDKRFVKIESKKTQGFLGLGKKDIVRKDMVAASQRGRSHAIEGKPRDDDFALFFDEDSEWYVMVVADGAGSAPFSRKGAQLACQTAVEVCKTQLSVIRSLLEEQICLYWNKKTEERKGTYEYLHQIVGKAAFEAYKKISEEATAKQRKLKEYATTLLLTICKKFDFGWFVGAFWVGDGGIGIYRQDPPELKVLGEADGGEFAGQTRFLTMQEIFSDRVRTRFEIVEDFTAVILMTDGVTDPKFETDANLNRIEKWHALWDDLNGMNEDNVKVDFADSEQSAEQLLNWLNFWSKGNHDDRTIAILF
ncbi:MAG: protein phosphatase 2C domain-containing protein [Tannerella sp.]|jgi:serine/threonine protein phosphatase PrpC|nr:protein phosphatase 2C domain-containing protein [Tannerella sp.]